MRYALGFLLCVSLATPLTAARKVSRPDLTGQVSTLDGKPIANAHVYIYTAGPREGVSQFCPSCYADCGKRAATTAGGQFRIATLDPALLFRVLAVAEGYEPAFLTRVDPVAGAVSFKLAPRAEGQCDREIRGRIVDSKGNPVVGATVAPKAMRKPTSIQFGGFTGTDALSVSNEKGEFVIRVGEPSNQYDVSIHARDLAPQMVAKLVPGDEPRKIQLVLGASVTGRVVRGNKPVAGIRIGIGQTSRRSESYLGETAIATDKDGKFLITNLLPHENYNLHAFMSELAPQAILTKRVILGDDDSRTDAGSLEVIPGRRLAGVVVMPDGKVLPAHTRVMIALESSMDNVTVELDPAGHFEFSGAPPEEVSVGINVAGYRVSSISPYMQFHRVVVAPSERDVTDIRLIMEPAPPPPQRPPV